MDRVDVEVRRDKTQVRYYQLSFSSKSRLKGDLGYNRDRDREDLYNC